MKTKTGMFEFYSETLKEALEKHAEKHNTTVDHVMEVCDYQARGEQAFIPHYEEPCTSGDRKEYPLSSWITNPASTAKAVRPTAPGTTISRIWIRATKPGRTWPKSTRWMGRNSASVNGDHIRLISPTGSIECTAKLWEGVHAREPWPSATARGTGPMAGWPPKYSARSPGAATTTT